MKKIISVFQRNYDGDRLVRDEVTPGAEWVLAGEGRATRKWDGTCCMAKDGVLYKRYDAKRGKVPPEGFIPAQDPDPVTGHYPGWLLVSDSAPEDQWHRNALLYFRCSCSGRFNIPNGTYELVGEHVQGNPEKLRGDRLIPHGNETIPDFPRTFNGMRDWLKINASSIEGVVFWHPDGRMAKIKAKDFGFKERMRQ